MKLPVRYKICCIKSPEEAAMAMRYGASAIGLVGKMPSGPGPIPDEQIARIAGTVPPGVSTFVLTSETRAEDIIAHYRKVNTSVIQIVDAIADDVCSEIRSALPHVKLVQVIHVADATSIEEARHVSRYADAILLDSGNPQLEIKVLGGTGRTHDWSISKKIVEAVKIPVFLAGGLNPNNVRDAIETVRPFGVDVCSGLRIDGNLDEARLKAFVEAIIT